MKHLLITTGLFLSFLILSGQESTKLDFDHFSFKVGYSVIQHLEPQIYGESINLNTANVLSGDLTGFNNMNGIDFKAYYFFKNNLGLYLNLGFGNSNNFIDYENAGAYNSLETKADFNNQSIGVASKLTSEKFPINVILGLNIGRYGYNMSYNQNINGNELWYYGTFENLKIGIEALFEYTIYKGLNLFSEVGYSTQPWVSGDDFYIDYKDGTGTYYSISYNSPSMAALRLTIGLGYSF